MKGVRSSWRAKKTLINVIKNDLINLIILSNIASLIGL